LPELRLQFVIFGPARSILSAIGLDRVRQKNAGANKRNDGHY
jgi:hypothetical protein